MASANVNDLKPSTFEEEQALKELKQKLNEQRSKININYDDHLLMKFLKSCDFKVNRTLTLFVEYSNARKNLPHIFVPFSDLYERFEKPLFVMCPKSNADQPTMAYLPLKNWDPSRNKLGEALESVVPHSEFCGLDRQVQDDGVIVLIDVTSISFSYMKYLT